MNLSDRAQTILNFKLNVRGWRDLVSELSVEHGCAQAKPHYHEVHLYCRAGLAERRRLFSLAERYGLWASRFRFTHERRDGKLIAVDGEGAREELMLGTHFHMPLELAETMASELLAVADQLDIDVERIRVERPMGRSPARVSERSDRGWWEAHLSVEHDDKFSESLRCEGIRDVSRKMDFVTGKGLMQGFVNIEARDQSARQFGAICTNVAQSLSQNSGEQVVASLEEVLMDWSMELSN